MRSTVLYASHKGNTRRIAEAIAERLQAEGTVDIHAVDESPNLPPDADLVLIGSPTEGHAAVEEVTRFLEQSGAPAWAGRLVATFETRVAWPRLLSGSAALDLRRRLTALGATVIRSDGSFIVSMAPDLKPGELERAAAWTDSVLASRARLRAVPAP
jgi:flavorubredoxin